MRLNRLFRAAPGTEFHRINWSLFRLERASRYLTERIEPACRKCEARKQSAAKKSVEASTTLRLRTQGHSSRAGLLGLSVHTGHLSWR